jgi:glycosyltransferase involved in cell wall biosynthesis
LNGSSRISVIVPAYNAEDLLPRCLEALAASSRPPDEIVVVDDGSTDRTPEIAREHGAVVIATARNAGPGAARNLGVEQASGDIVVFIDADVVAHADTLARIEERFRDPDVAALFGSYDDAPAHPGFVSQYKNLQHHHVHQAGAGEASTFWAGCGAIRRDTFRSVGGFDVERFPKPAIEDIELGYRLRDRGHRIVLDPRIQVCHLKHWTLGNLIVTDVRQRAIPWTTLLLERGGAPGDLNLGSSERIAAGLAWATLAAVPAAAVDPRMAAIGAATGLGFLFVNRGFYGFLRRARGTGFVLRAIPLHALYYLYSSVAFAWCVVRHGARRAAGRVGAGDRS